MVIFNLDTFSWMVIFHVWLCAVHPSVPAPYAQAEGTGTSLLLMTSLKGMLGVYACLYLRAQKSQARRKFPGPACETYARVPRKAKLAKTV